MLSLERSDRLYLLICLFLTFEDECFVRGEDCNTRLVQTSEFLPSGGILNVRVSLKGRVKVF